MENYTGVHPSIWIPPMFFKMVLTRCCSISRHPGGLCVWGELCAALPLPAKQWYDPPLDQEEWEERSGPLLLRWPGPTGIPGPSLQGKDLPVPWPDLRGQRIPWSGQGEPPGPGQVPVLRQHFTEQPGDLRQPDSERWAQVLFNRTKILNILKRTTLLSFSFWCTTMSLQLLFLEWTTSEQHCHLSV